MSIWFNLSMILCRLALSPLRKFNTMKLQVLLLSVFAAGFALASPTTSINTPSKVLDERQGCRVVTPTPCQYISPPPTEEETKARHALFFDAFINKKNLSEAFKYIDNVYKVRCSADKAVLLGQLIASRTTILWQETVVPRRRWISLAASGATRTSGMANGRSRTIWDIWRITTSSTGSVG